MYRINQEKLNETCLKLFNVAIELATKEMLLKMQYLLGERLKWEEQLAKDKRTYEEDEY